MMARTDHPLAAGRGALLCALLLAASRVAAAAAAAAAPRRFGAIRWDSWVPVDSGLIVAKVLSPPRWHDRLPWFTTLNASGWPLFNGSTREVVDAEIAMAAAAGIDHFAFDIYPPQLSLSTALQNFLSSTALAKARVGFCMLLQAGWMAQGGLAAWPESVALYASFFARADYTLVLGDRPLVYLFSVYEGAWGSSWAGWATALGMLNNASIAAGRGEPYYALQIWGANDGISMLNAINAAAGGRQLVSALSAYALPGATDAGTPWAAFAASGAEFWRSLAATGADVIPCVAAGWDDRPRNESGPLPWQNFTDPSFVVGPTPAELADFVALADAYVADNAKAVPTGVALLSAWNEYDEGHWIGAVLPEYGGNARLDAIAGVLRPASHQHGARAAERAQGRADE
jgi:hypothetical protein